MGMIAFTHKKSSAVRYVQAALLLALCTVCYIALTSNDDAKSTLRRRLPRSKRSKPTNRWVSPNGTPWEAVVDTATSPSHKIQIDLASETPAARAGGGAAGALKPFSKQRVVN